MNKKGNVLINAILTLSLSSVVIVNIARSTVTNTFFQDSIFEREMGAELDDLDNQVDYSPYQVFVDYGISRFESKYDETYNKILSNTANKFKNDLKKFSKDNNYNKDLDCENPTVVNYKSMPYKDIVLVCHYDDKTDVVLTFTITEYEKDGKVRFNSIFHKFSMEIDD